MRRFAAFLLTALVAAVLMAVTAPKDTLAMCGPTGAGGNPCIDGVTPTTR